MQLTRDDTEARIVVQPRGHETIHRFHVEAACVDPGGFVGTGTLLEWADAAAHVTAAQWCGGRCAAASVGDIRLRGRIGVGAVVEVRATLVYTGRSSMHILVTVSAGGLAWAGVPQSAQCTVVFVAIDGSGQAVAVPRWVPSTMLEMQRHRQARTRARTRRRVDAAMEAEEFTATGTAPGSTLRLRAGATDVTADAEVRGGRVMRWIDEAAYACGAEWVGADVATCHVAGIRFARSVLIGDLVEATARVIHTDRHGVHVGVRVLGAADPSLRVADAVVVVASPGPGGEAREVPQWRPVSNEDERLDRLARHLIELRQYL